MKHKSISACVSDSLDDFFINLDEGTKPRNLYSTILAQIEKPLLDKVMQYSLNNRTTAAQILGINPATLRKKLSIYKIVT